MFTFFKKYRGNRGNTLTFQQSFELDWNATSHIGVGTLNNAKQFFKRHHLLWFRSSNPKNVFKICPFKFAFLPVPQFPPRFYPPITYLATAKRALHQNKKNIFLNNNLFQGLGVDIWFCTWLRTWNTDSDFCKKNW